MFFRRSRRRAEPTPAAAPSKLPSTSKSIYEPLPQNIESTRFLRIAPASRDTDPIVCSLVQIPLSERPRFAALSYMWGPETPTGTIRVNGRQFGVRKNLAGALRCLRRQMAGMSVGLFWIDALCINQADVEERSRQVRMMGQIYLRAQEVVVWLGAKYQTYLDKLARIPKELRSSLGFMNDKRRQAAAAASQHEKRMDIEREMVRTLMADGYWDRLWIIQEVSLNEIKRMCFGNLVMSWEDLVQLAVAHGGSAGGPLRLDRHLKERYAGSRTLRRLLMDHQHSLCQDRRDKIYGLVGLASDGQGFPVDYRKSHAEVWADTMEFLNRHRLFSADRETEIVDFAGLIKSLLTDPQSPQMLQPARPHHAQVNQQLIVETTKELSSNAKVFHVKAYILGLIGAIGPSSKEVVSSSAKAQEWIGSFRTTFRNELNSAYDEGNKVIKAIVSSQEKKITSMCPDHTGLVRWRAFGLSAANRGGYPESLTHPPAHGGSDGAVHSPRGDACLYQMAASSGRPTRWKTGLVSRQAQPGDLVCWIRGVSRAVVLRTSKGPDGSADSMLQVIGTATVAEDVAEARVDHDERCNSIGSQCMTLKLDGDTVLMLLS